MKMGDRKMNYQEFANQIQADILNNKNEWYEKYFCYAIKLIDNEQNIRERRKEFRKWGPLQVYTTIGSVIKNSSNFDIRYLGQSVATISVTENKGPKATTATGERTVKLSTENKVDTNKKYFDYDRLIKNEDWNSPVAKEFREYFKNIKNRQPRQREHMLENRILGEFEKSTADNKAFRWIQPVSFAGCRFHMKTAIKGSAKEKLISKNGGEIDVFCRQKVGNNIRLSIVEVKDENIVSESLEITMKQAIAYAVFIRELVRSSNENGRAWLKIWGISDETINKQINNPLELNAIVAMPYKRDETPDFSGQFVQLGEDKIYLHYMLAKNIDKSDVMSDLSKPIEFEKSF